MLCYALLMTPHVGHADRLGQVQKAAYLTNGNSRQEFGNLALISALEEIFLTVPSRLFLSNVFHFGGLRYLGFSTHCSLCPTSREAIDHAFNHLGPFCNAAWFSGCFHFSSYLIFLTTDVITDKNIEVSDPLKVTEIVKQLKGKIQAPTIWSSAILLFGEKLGSCTRVLGGMRPGSGVPRSPKCRRTSSYCTLQILGKN